MQKSRIGSFSTMMRRLAGIIIWVIQFSLCNEQASQKLCVRERNRIASAGHSERKKKTKKRTNEAVALKFACLTPPRFGPSTNPILGIEMQMVAGLPKLNYVEVMITLLSLSLCLCPKMPPTFPRTFESSSLLIFPSHCWFFV